MIEGLKKHNYENFWEINQSLCDRSIGELKKYSLRIFSNRHHTYVQPNIDVNKFSAPSGSPQQSPADTSAEEQKDSY